MPDLTKSEQKKIMSVAAGFAKECEDKGISEEDTKEMILEVMKATAEVLLEDREKSKK